MRTQTLKLRHSTHLGTDSTRAIDIRWWWGRFLFSTELTSLLWMEGRWRAGRIFWLSQLHLIPPVSAARNSWPPLPDNSVCCTPGDWPYHPDDYLLIEIRRALKSAKLSLFEEEDDCRVPHQAVRLSAWGEMLRVVILGNCFGHWLARSMWQNMKPLPTHQTDRHTDRKAGR